MRLLTLLVSVLALLQFGRLQDNDGGLGTYIHVVLNSGQKVSIIMTKMLTLAAGH